MTRGTGVTAAVGLALAALALAVASPSMAATPLPAPTTAATGVAGTASSGGEDQSGDQPSGGIDQPGSTGALAAQQRSVAGSLASASQDVETETVASQQADAALTRAQAALPAASATLAAAHQAARVAEAALVSANHAVAATRQNLAVLDARSAIEKQQVTDKRAALDTAVRASYIAGPTGLARDVLNSTDPSQLLDDNVALGRQGQVTGGALDDLNRALAVLVRDEAQATTDSEALIVQQQQANSAVITAKVSALRAAASAEHLQSLVHQRAAAAAQVKASLAEDSKRYDELQNESDAIGALLVAAEAKAAAAAAAARAAAATSTTQGSAESTAQPGPGGLLWPTSGPVTSPFGYRVDPVTHQRALHAGVDIGAPEGQAIMAAQSGVVAFAGMEQGYGNYTCIDHGGGFATCYAHQSAIYVTVGQSVTRGQRIGLVGDTGYATGPHLHFETRVNGVPVNPMQYF